MTGNLPITFINLFFVPMISMKICYRRMKRELEFNESFFVQYAIYCTVIPTITKIIVHVLKMAVDIGIEMAVDSSNYTAAAIIVAYILPYIVEIWKKNVCIKCSIRGIERRTDEKKVDEKKD